MKGLTSYASGDLEGAIQIWNEALDIDRHFDPAEEGIRTASITLELQKRIRELQQLE